MPTLELYTVLPDMQQTRELPVANLVVYKSLRVAEALATYVYTRSLLEEDLLSTDNLLNEFAIACKIAFKKYHAEDARDLLREKDIYRVYDGLLHYGELQRECSDPSDVPVADPELLRRDDGFFVFKIGIEADLLSSLRVVKSIEDLTGLSELEDSGVFSIPTGRILNISVYSDIETVLGKNTLSTGSQFFPPY